MDFEFHRSVRFEYAFLYMGCVPHRADLARRLDACASRIVRRTLDAQCGFTPWPTSLDPDSIDPNRIRARLIALDRAQADRVRQLIPWETVAAALERLT